MEESNRVLTEEDVRRHPELHLAYRAHRYLELAYRAHRYLEPEARTETVLYRSTEPCPMCAGGLRYAGFDRVAYSVGADEIADFVGREPPIRAEAILEDVTDVVGPVLNGEGRRVHEEFDW